MKRDAQEDQTRRTGRCDLLRLEMAYLLYGNDMNEQTTPIEAGADWVVKFDKGDFIGRAELLDQHSQGEQVDGSLHLSLSTRPCLGMGSRF